MRIAFILLFASVLISRADENAAGRWEGTLQIPGRELVLIVDLGAENGGGRNWQGSITIPALGIKGAPLSDIALSGDNVAFSIKSALADPHSGPAKFNAHFDGRGKLAGSFEQAGNFAPFALEKTGPPQVEAPPHSTVVAKEIEGEWKGGYELFGYPRKVTIKLQNRGAEGATAEFVIVGRKENKLPVDRVVQQGEFLTVDSHETGLTFEGRARNNEIQGTVIQGPLEIPVTLRRGELPRPATAATTAQ
jgi:hypothetical protein